MTFLGKQLDEAMTTVPLTEQDKQEFLAMRSKLVSQNNWLKNFIESETRKLDKEDREASEKLAEIANRLHRLAITFKTDGTAQHVGDNSLLAGSIARVTKRRASHVTPVNPVLRAGFWLARAIGLAEWTRTWGCAWQVQIIGGPVLPKQYSDRAEAIRDEISYLEENRL